MKESSMGGKWKALAVPEVDTILTIATGGMRIWVVSGSGQLWHALAGSKEPKFVQVSSPDKAGKCVSVCVSPDGSSVWATFAAEDPLTWSVHRLKGVKVTGGQSEVLPAAGAGWDAVTPQIEGKAVTRVCPTALMPVPTTAVALAKAGV